MDIDAEKEESFKGALRYFKKIEERGFSKCGRSFDSRGSWEESSTRCEAEITDEKNAATNTASGIDAGNF